MKLSENITNKKVLKTYSTLEADMTNVHKGKYDYKYSIYKNKKTKIKILCSIHGVFEQTPGNHLSGQGCRKCFFDNKPPKPHKSEEDVLKDFKKVHGDRYDYSRVIYKGLGTKVKILCAIHGVFEQTPSNHKAGSGCNLCSLEKSEEDVLKDFKKVHGDRYDYSRVIYKGSSEKVKILCAVHGEFEQIVSNHNNGFGCKKCNVRKNDRKKYNLKPTILYHVLVNGLEKVGLRLIRQYDNIEDNILKGRFSKDIANGIDIKIINYKTFKDGSLAWDKEPEILNSTKSAEYIGEKILVSGNTEIRTCKLSIV